jgi:hypothetical protein
MSEISLLVVIEAGQVRSLSALAFQLPLPESLIWGPAVLTRIEGIAQEATSWPTDRQLASAVIIDRDARRLVRAGASETFDTPYQLVLFDRMLSAAWQGYDVDHIELTRPAIAAAAGIDPPPIDPKRSQQMVRAAMGGDHELDDEEDEDEDYEFDEFDDGEGDDFRQLITKPNAAADGEAMMRQYEDQHWLVSVRANPDQPYRHYLGDFVMQTFTEGGPEVIGQLNQFTETEMLKEQHASRGIVVDVDGRTLSIWAHPRGLSWWGDLDRAWPGWNIERWLTNGFRRHLDATGEAERIVIPSDLQALAGFVPDLTEQLDLDAVLGQLTSGVRGFVRRGFGCLAVVLAVPAMIAWAVSGSWQGPFAFAATVWVMAYIAYRVFAAKLKRNFSGLSAQKEKAAEMLPKLAPQDEQERIQIVAAALQSAGLPDFEQVVAYAERDDEDDEDISPIVSG